MTAKNREARMGTVWINNGETEKTIPRSEIYKFSDWKRGRLISMQDQKEATRNFRSGKIYVTNGRTCHHISKSDFRDWQERGFERGRIIRNIRITDGTEKRKISIFELQKYFDEGWERY